MKASAIITTFNRRQYVLDAIRSVAEQSLTAHEIIVVVDGSTDGTIEAISTTYPSVKIVSQPNRGRSVARNHGVAVATGDWVAFLDDDDFWHREKLQEISSYLSLHPECEAINHWFYLFSNTEDEATHGFGASRDFVAKSIEECHDKAEGRAVTNSFNYLDILGNSFNLLLECNRGALSASMVRRTTAIAAGGFPPSASYAEDWMFFLNVARLAEWHTLAKPLGFQRLHASQSTGDSQNLLTMIAAKVAMWHTGRAFPLAISDKAKKSELRKRGRAYRCEVQSFFWGSLTSMRVGAAMSILRLGATLLPRLRDRLFVMVPPQLTWRVERLLGMHK